MGGAYALGSLCLLQVGVPPGSALVTGLTLGPVAMNFGILVQGPVAVYERALLSTPSVTNLDNDPRPCGRPRTSPFRTGKTLPPNGNTGDPLYDDLRRRESAINNECRAPESRPDGCGFSW